MITYTGILAAIVIAWCVLMVVNFVADIALAKSVKKKDSIKEDNEPFVYDDSSDKYQTFSAERITEEIEKLNSIPIKIKYFDDAIINVEKFEKGDWVDLRAAESVGLSKGEFKLIPLGIAMELPEGYEAHVVPRSSTYKNYKILQTNSMGRYTF